MFIIQCNIFLIFRLELYNIVYIFYKQHYFANFFIFTFKIFFSIYFRFIKITYFLLGINVTKTMYNTANVARYSQGRLK